MDKATRKRYGVSGKPLQATRAFARPMDHKFAGLSEAWSVWAVDEVGGTLTQVNIYGTLQDGYAGKGFDPSNYRQPFQGWESEKAKDIQKGYSEVPVGNIGILVQAKQPQAKEERKAPAKG